MIDVKVYNCMMKPKCCSFQQPCIPMYSFLIQIGYAAACWILELQQINFGLSLLSLRLVWLKRWVVLTYGYGLHGQFVHQYVCLFSTTYMQESGHEWYESEGFSILHQPCQASHKMPLNHKTSNFCHTFKTLSHKNIYVTKPFVI